MAGIYIDVSVSTGILSQARRSIPFWGDMGSERGCSY